MNERATTARRLLSRENMGVLATHSVDMDGYPFGSIAPYALDHGGRPVMLLSDIAQHTRNLKRDPRVSLTVFERFADDPQAGGRVTWVGDVAAVDAADAATRERYMRYFPWTVDYFAMHDFALYRIELRRARFIGGFGQIFWIDAAAMAAENPFRDSEADIVEHMNRDHARALSRYCELLGAPAADGVAMSGIDADGFDLLVGRRKLRFELDAPIATPEEARAALVRLARS
jgi:putative heme iron utilization protein